MSNQNNYNPDVLSCLANLSNDEVFTPPEVANAMLDLLPQELFTDPDAKFLDPACKSGVFLREIAKRLIEGLAEKIPDLQERIDHIFKEQLYAIAITELTRLLARRSVYCSKDASSKYSVSKFEKSEGNIFYTNTKHLCTGDKCLHCGASKSEYGDENREGLERHAYQFIHNAMPGEIENMKFDVIIGNPPYQLNDGGGTGSSAMPIYHYFVKQAKKLNPRYLTMIIPARWYAGGKGLDDFRKEMLNDNHIRNLVDFFDSEDCFPGIDLSGGVCYFLWNRDNGGECEIKSILNNEITQMERPLLENGTDTFIRFNQGISIFRKIQQTSFSSFENIVSSRKPFGDIPKSKEGNIKVYAYPDNFVIFKSKIKQGIELIDKYKVMIAKAYGERGDFPYLVIGKPFIGEPNSCCTETYLTIGMFNEMQEAQNVITYMRTKFFRFLVLFKKNTQNAPKGVYQFVPLQDFSKPWTDEELYAKYNLSPEEIAFIESMIRPME